MADVPSHLIASPVLVSLLHTVWCFRARLLPTSCRAPCRLGRAIWPLMRPQQRQVLLLFWPLAFVAFAAAFGHLADPRVSLRLGFWVPCATFDLPLAPMFPSPVGQSLSAEVC